MQIIFNGQPREVPDEQTVADFVRSLDLATTAYAVELNQEVLPRKKHAEQMLSAGDRVEVVTLVGGG